MEGRAIRGWGAETVGAKLRQPALTREAERMRRALGGRRRTVTWREAVPAPADSTAFKGSGLR